MLPHLCPHTHSTDQHKHREPTTGSNQGDIAPFMNLLHILVQILQPS